jgi:hypothetical protein
MKVSGELHAPVALPQEKAPGTHWIGGWVGASVVLDAVEKRKIPRLPAVKLGITPQTESSKAK